MSANRLVLAFRAGGERWAVSLERVREAARPRRITPLPGAPASWRGVALVRGQALGVVDVAAAVGKAPAGPAASPLVVVLRGCEHALLVDSVDGVEPLSEGEPGAGAAAAAVLLDVDRLGAGSGE